MSAPGHRVRRATIPRDECLGLLRRADYARVVISVRCLPAALPARIAVVDDYGLLLASAEEAVVVAARRGDVLSVQIDGLEPDGATWSVMASGIAALPDGEPPLSTALTRAVAGGASIVALPLTIVTGERIG